MSGQPQGKPLFFLKPLLPQSHVESVIEGACLGTLLGVTADSVGVELCSLLPGGGKQPGPVNKLLTCLWLPTPAFFRLTKNMELIHSSAFLGLQSSVRVSKGERFEELNKSFFGNFKEHILMIIFYGVHRVGFQNSQLGR